MLFDASASTLGDVGTYTFHDIIYSFDFGDPGSGTWAVSGESKNAQSGGPLAAHVFENPGTYTVFAGGVDSLGRSSVDSVVIEVADPDVVYAGAATVAVSTSGDFTDAPSGAATVTSLAAAAPFENKRVLLRRGESFGALTLDHGTLSCRVAPFGTGDKPQVTTVAIGPSRPLDAADFPADIVVQDLDIANGVEQTASAQRIVIMRCDLDDAGPGANNMINFSGALSYWAGSGPDDDPFQVVNPADFYHPREMFFVENTILGSTEADDVPFGNIYGAGSRIAILGNVLGGATQHTLRMFALHKSVIAHNDLQGRSSDGIRHSLKLHSGGFAAYADSYAAAPSFATSQVVIADNRGGNAADNNDWTIAVTPQNNGENLNEGIEDVILERNAMVVGIKTQQDIRVAGRRITVRGTTRSGAGGALVLFDATNTDYVGLPADWRGPNFIE